VAVQALQRRDRLVDQDGAAAHAFDAITRDDLGAERLLAVEVVVERSLGDAGGGGDLLHADAVEALLQKALQTGIENLFADIGSRHE
jgi:hypothetical protein